MAKRARMRGRDGDGDSGRRGEVKLVNIVLLSLAVFSNQVHAIRHAERIPHFPRQVAGFNTTTATASTSLISSSSHSALSPTLLPIQNETSSISSVASQRGTASGAQFPGGTLSTSAESGTGRTSSTTSDEIGSHISSKSSTARPTNGTSGGTVVVTSESSSFQSARAPTNSGVFTSLNSSWEAPTTTPTTTAIVEDNEPTLMTITLGEPSETESFETELGCIPTPEGAIPTTWSIIYTSTTTFYGDPTNYTPPSPEITTFCPPIMPGDKGRARPSVSGCDPEDVEECTAPAEPSLSFTMTGPKVKPGLTTVTFVTTAKHPSVVYSPISTPFYGHDPVTRAPLDKHTAVESANIPQLPNNQRPRESAKQPTKASYTVTVAPTKVIINDQMFTQKTPSETTQVMVGGAEFTINPSQVIGGGTVVDRHGNLGITTVAASSTIVGGIPVVIAPAGTQNAVAIGGTTFEVQSTPVTAVVQGQTITIEPSSIVFPKQTVSISGSLPVQTGIVVEGGEMITAIGPSVVVIRSTTLTYGLASSTITETIDNDTILIGPSGVLVYNMTLGGPNAKPSETTFEIVGGATITQVGASVVVVEGATFTVGPRRGTTTTVVGGKTITIGPSGISVSTLSVPYPFEPTVITTIGAPTSTEAPAPVPSETKTNGGAVVRYARMAAGAHLEFCIAIGAWVLGRMV